MKRIFGALLALFSAVAFGATEVPVQLLNPTGSSSGMPIVSTGASSAPGWSATLGGITFTGTTQVSDSSPVFALNDTSSTSFPAIFFNKAAVGVWALTNNSASGTLTINRYVSGVLTDNPISIANGTGIVTMPDGITNSPISGSTGSFTTLAASSTVSGTGFSTYLASPPAIGGTAAAAGNFTTLGATGLITPSTTNGIKGTTAADSANAGSVGEVITASVASGSAISVSNGVAANVTSISLTAGDWDVWGQVVITPTATTTTVGGWVNTVSAAQPTYSNNAAAGQVLPFTDSGTGGASVLSTGTARINVSTTTTVYLGVFAGFASGTCTSYGYITARRRR